MRKDIGFADKAIPIDVSGGNQALPSGCRAFYVGGTGDLAVTMHGGGNATFVGLPAGVIIPINASAVLQSGTSATSVLALL